MGMGIVVEAWPIGNYVLIVTDGSVVLTGSWVTF